MRPDEVDAFTTTDILSGKKPVLVVVHDGDGDWQFFSSDDVSLDGARLVSLEQIIKLDASFLELVSKLRPGSRAYRFSEYEEWRLE